MIAANLPDGEFFFVPRGERATYLLVHRGWSHSLLGIALEIVGLSLLVMLILWLVSRRSESRGPPRLDRILLVVGLCAYSHLFLDWWNTYGVRPFYPFEKSWYYGDLAVLMDPWIWLLFGATLFLASSFRAERPKEPKSGAQANSPSWGIVVVWSLVLFYICFFFQRAFRENAGQAGPVIWILCATAIVIVRLAWAKTPRPRRMACVAIVSVGVYLGCLAAFGNSALDRGIEAFQQQHPDVVATKTSSNPVHGIPWRREVLVETKDKIYQYSVNVRTGTLSLSRKFPRNLDDPGFSKIENERAHIAWKSFARHPIARREESWLILGDARYAIYARRGDWTEQRVKVE